VRDDRDPIVTWTMYARYSPLPKAERFRALSLPAVQGIVAYATTITMAPISGPPAIGHHV
jgi:hypothetical protein